MGVRPRFTVFTPTYNRADTLHRVFDSLRAQTVPAERFEWLVVDDGSRDDTAARVERWRAEAPFAVRYVWQENGGKHRAWNHGVRLAQGELFSFLDSDDACVPEALARLDEVWREAGGDADPRLAGVFTRCRDANGTPVGPPFPHVRRASFSELVFRHGWRHETWTMVRTDLLQRHPFPDGPRGLLVPEGILWHALSEAHEFVILDEALRIYYTGEHGRADQLSHPPPLARQAPGLALAHRSALDHAFGRWFDAAPMTFIGSAVHLSRFALHAKQSPLAHIRAIRSPAARALCLAALPASVAAYAIDRVRRR